MARRVLLRVGAFLVVAVCVLFGALFPDLGLERGALLGVALVALLAGYLGERKRRRRSVVVSGVVASRRSRRHPGMCIVRTCDGTESAFRVSTFGPIDFGTEVTLHVDPDDSTNVVMGGDPPASMAAGIVVAMMCVACCLLV